MYVIVLGIFIIKLQISISDPQFPAHVDLQKVGEAIFNNEKFNILKTTTHVITDHFKEFMLRSGNNNHPAERVFIDKNGFRHEWSGFGEKIKSLRKTDLKYVSGSFENASENTPKSDIIMTDGNINMANTVEDTNNNNVSSQNSDENNEDEEKNNASDNNKSVQYLTKENNETDSKETTTTIHSATQENNSSTDITIEKRLRTGENDDKNKKDSKKNDKKNKDDTNNEEKKKDDKNKEQVNNTERTVMKTTFFCPYLGIISMSRFIDI